jgi:hypothetical protein
MVQVAVTDLSAYFDDEITAMPNLVTTAATTVGALDSGSITSGFGAIDNGTSNIRSATITAETAFVPDAANGASLGTTSLEFADLYLHDGAQILWGADQDVLLTHVADAGLTLKTATTSDDTQATLTLQTGDTDIAANDVIGQLHFQAPDEGTGTDAILVAAGIAAVSEGDFSSSNNATKLVFKTAASEAASEKMSLSSAGILTVADDIIIGDGKTIGSASDPDAITIASNGQLTLTQTLIGTALDISGDIDVDGTTNLDAVDIDGLTTCVNIHSISTDTTDQVILENTDTGSASAPDLVFYRNSSSPADNDFLLRIDARGRNDNSQDVNYMSIYTQALDVSDGTEGALTNFEMIKAGSGSKVLVLSGTEVVINEDSTDTDFRVESNGQASAFFVNANADTASFAVPLSGTSADFDGGVTIDNITIDGTEIDLSSGDLTLDVAGDIILNADGGDIKFADAAVDLISFTNSSSDVVIKPLTDAKDIIFQQYDGTSILEINDGAYAKFTAAAIAPEATLTDASTVTINALTQSVSKVTLGGNRTIGLASGGVAGAFISLLIIQDGTGSRTVSWNAAYEFAADTAPTLTTTANLGDLFVFRYNGAKWLEVGRNLALTLS